MARKEYIEKLRLLLRYIFKSRCNPEWLDYTQSVLSYNNYAIIIELEQLPYTTTLHMLFIIISSYTTGVRTFSYS